MTELGNSSSASDVALSAQTHQSTVNQNRVCASKELVSHLIEMSTEYCRRHKRNAKILYRANYQ